MGLHQTKKFLWSKRKNLQMKRQPTKWEKLFANCVSDKQLISTKHKEPLQLKSNKSKQTKDSRKPIHLKNKQRVCKHFFKESTQTVNKYMLKRCSTLLITREMQIKTTMWYHLTPVRMDIIKKTRDNKCQCADVEKREPWYTVIGGV